MTGTGATKRGQSEKLKTFISLHEALDTYDHFGLM